MEDPKFDVVSKEISLNNASGNAMPKKSLNLSLHGQKKGWD